MKVKQKKCKICGVLVHEAYWSGILQVREFTEHGSTVHFCSELEEVKNDRQD